MRRHAAVLLAVTLLLAGCVGGQGGLATTTSTPNHTETTSEAATTEAVDETTTDGEANDDETESGSTVNFYLSDEENAMDDFTHLNVTVSSVGFQRAGGNWTTYEVDDRTVDLTRFRGANATRLGTFAVENGSYEKVFVHVSEVNGTLKNGETVRVKLPSEKLQIHQTFSIGANQSVDYVFDISVFKAGKSGKYILKPVISESGTDKEIETIGDDEKDDENEREDEEDSEDETERETETEDALNATFVGNVTAGENATVAVTRNGSAVANATVSVNGEVVGETDTNGTFSFSVPDSEELEVEIETEDGSAELEIDLQADGEGDEKDSDTDDEEGTDEKGDEGGGN